MSRPASALALALTLITLAHSLPAHAADDDSPANSSSHRRAKRHHKRKHKAKVQIETATTPAQSNTQTVAAPETTSPVSVPRQITPVAETTSRTPADGTSIEEAPPSYNPFGAAERPVGHLVLRLDFGVGGGTDGFLLRLAPGIDTRFAANWGLGLSLAGIITWPMRSGLRGEGDADVRLFFELDLAKGWLRLQLSGGPMVLGKTAHTCTSPLCGYEPAVPPTLGGFGAFEISYWLARGPGAVGGAVRAQADTASTFILIGSINFGADLSVPWSNRSLR